jgi:NADPH:quinone reductase-like Zn-dependent oxidoreductase
MNDGAPSVGQYAIQLARIITNASTTNHHFLEELGAHIVLNQNFVLPKEEGIYGGTEINKLASMRVAGLV